MLRPIGKFQLLRVCVARFVYHDESTVVSHADAGAALSFFSSRPAVDA
jgi:hypothetical protein